MKSEYKIGDRLEVTIQKIVPQGLGLAFAENLTVFVPLSAPGDKLSVRIYQLKGKTAFAEIESVIEASPVRIEPPCPYFGKCGGCDFQQMAYDAQLAAKLDMIRDSLKRIGKIDYENEIPMIASPKPFEYRSRAQWHLETREKKIGYFKRNSHDIIDIEHCPILEPALDNTLKDLRTTLNWNGFWANRAEVEAASGSDGRVSLYSPEIVEPTDDISFNAGGVEYFYSAQSFFQGNQSLIEQLIEAALSGATGERSLDLYCGVGLFTIPLAKKFSQVIGVEGNERAIEFAERNAAAARLENISFEAESVSEFLAGRELEGTDFVVLDPPRTGTEKNVIDRIVNLKPQAISYIACDPSMLARDLRQLIDGGYTIASITALDLFPQTHHVETVVRLEASQHRGR
ncbi:MAG: class I SAM-dependent RNA methyltransferase [Pyrinomonadaceae bacterium]